MPSQIYCPIWVVSLVGAGFVGCSAEPPEHTARASSPVVFGTDDREDYYEASDPAFATLLQRATVALVEPAYIDVSDPNNIVPDTVSLGDYQDLCIGEPYSDQPAMASCSGTLIDDDLVLTAAHCVDETVCADWYFVFDFYMTSTDQLNVMTAEDVYRCAEIVVYSYTPDGEPRPWDDYAIVRLDRPVDDQREPAPIDMNPASVVEGDAITVLGFGNGIPGKIHGGATVTTANVAHGYFIGSTDTFAGNSGSGTYSAEHELVGVFVRGGHDDYAASGSCQVVNTVSEALASQEYDYAYKAIDTLCDGGYESERLCPTDEPDPDPEDPEPAGCQVSPQSSTGMLTGVVMILMLAAAGWWRRLSKR